jgi:hypothetical protein
LAETAAAAGLAGSDAIDGHLITGGLPGILLRWPAGTPADDYLRAECADPAAPLFTVPEQSLASEFPHPDLARRVFEAIGGDARAYANIASTAGSRGGSVSSGTLSPLLRQLTDDKRDLESRRRRSGLATLMPSRDLRAVWTSARRCGSPATVPGGGIHDSVTHLDHAGPACAEPLPLTRRVGCKLSR